MNSARRETPRSTNTPRKSKHTNQSEPATTTLEDDEQRGHTQPRHTFWVRANP